MQDGDSGSVVSITNPRKKNHNIAIGRLQGRHIHKEDTETEGATGGTQEGTRDGTQDIYEAIILCHALQEIATEYPHLIGPLTRYSKKGRGARPPNAPIE